MISKEGKPSLLITILFPMKSIRVKFLRGLIITGRLPFFWFVLLIWSLTYFTVALLYFVWAPETRGNEIFSDQDLAHIFFLTCIVAPLFETFLFQSFAIMVVKKLLSRNICIQAGISAVLFSLAHLYNGWYVFFTFIIGLVFGTGYIAYYRRGGFMAFMAIATAHFLRNLAAFTYNAI
ncbi:MAG: type II CAAX prenyl endopeptidase Rce1 family protein [Bacteroidota bacterium]